MKSFIAVVCGLLALGASTTITLRPGDRLIVNVTTPSPLPTASPSPTPQPSPTAIPTASPSPAIPPLAYFALQPIGTALPSDSTCAAVAAGDSFEPRPVNAPANATIPSAAFLTTYRTAVANGEGGAQGSYLQRASGAFNGGTDAILKWASCKWGFDEDVTRATAVNESHWNQGGIGDVGNGISLGILQVKSRDYPSTCAKVASSQNVADVNDPACQSHLSTAFDADYKLAQQRACFEGKVAYLFERTPSAGYPAYMAGTQDQQHFGCVGWWMSGGWYDAKAIAYIGQVKTILAARTWAQPGF